MILSSFINPFPEINGGKIVGDTMMCAKIRVFTALSRTWDTYASKLCPQPEE
jgi:hypothetical protein